MAAPNPWHETGPTPACRFCGAPLAQTFADLGETPLANSYVRKEEAAEPDRTYPLHARVCGDCFLVQVNEAVPPEQIFSDYAYFSSYAASWVEHARRYAIEMIERWHLGPDSLVVEVASNDGYLLKHFVEAGVPVLGIEPAANVAQAARAAGVTTEVCFFNADTASRLVAQGRRADLIAANNVLAHVPDINGFVAGFPILLAPQGVLSVEFPHLLNLIRELQFDTIYHEHYSYLSLLAVERVFARHELRVFEIEELPTHGGSLRVFASRAGASYIEHESVERIRRIEHEAGLDRLETYASFQPKIERVKRGLREFLRDAKREGKRVAAYGAAAKGNTLLNVCDVTAHDIDFVVDRNPEKQGKLLPGSRVPVFSPEKIFEEKPDYVLILPWNLADEIRETMTDIRAWGGRFVTAVPEIRIYD